jgi:hypothetical protein
MNYEDISLGRYAVTIIVEEGDNFYKIPLRDYDGLNDFLRRGRTSSVDLSVLDGVTYIGSKQPVADISQIAEARDMYIPVKKPNKTKPTPTIATDTANKPSIIVYVGDDGYFYITPAAAHQIFDINQNMYDQSPTYRLTADQLLHIRETCRIHYSFVRKLPNKAKPNLTNSELFHNALLTMALENKLDPYAFIGRFMPIHYVAVDADDTYVFRGETNPSLLTGGTIEYRYDEASRTFRRVKEPADAEGYFEHIAQMMHAHEAYAVLDNIRGNDDEQRRHLDETYGIAVEDIPDYVGSRILYRFVGRWNMVPLFDTVKPLEEEFDTKHTLSSCLLGYIDSQCISGSGPDRTVTNVRELKERQVHSL